MRPGPSLQPCAFESLVGGGHFGGLVREGEHALDGWSTSGGLRTGAVHPARVCSSLKAWHPDSWLYLCLLASCFSTCMESGLHRSPLGKRLVVWEMINDFHYTSDGFSRNFFQCAFNQTPDPQPWPRLAQPMQVLSLSTQGGRVKID